MNTSKKPIAKVSTTEPAAGSVTEDAIRERAFELYEQHGRTDGQAVEDWLAAEAELQQRSVPA